MSIPQGRDGPFNPTSPHSSSGLADSFKGTPDTRLTAFSPEDRSTKSLRAPHSVGASARDSGPVKFKVGTPASLNRPRRQPLLPLDPTTDRDPFTSSGVTGIQVGRKLSPTASCFSPFTETGVASGSTQVKVKPVKTKSEENHETSSGIQSSVAGGLAGVFVHHELSTDLGISRCVIVATPIRGSKIHAIDVEQYISVSSYPSIPSRFLSLASANYNQGSEPARVPFPWFEADLPLRRPSLCPLHQHSRCLPVFPERWTRWPRLAY
jgi:hypothetical protein